MRQKYVVLFCATVILIYESGIMKSFGVLLPTLREQLETQTWVIGLTISLIPGIGSFACLPLPSLRKSGMFDPGYTIMCVGALTGVGLILGSVCKNASAFAVTMVMQSFMALAKVTALGILPNYFDVDSIDMANSIASCGMSFGVIGMPPITQFILDLYGWKGSLWILGALSFHYIVCGGLILHSEKHLHIKSSQVSYRELHNPETDSGSKPETVNAGLSLCNTPNEINNPATDLVSKPKLTAKALCNSLNIELLTNVSFLNILILSISVGWTYTCWLIYLIPHAEAKNVKPSSAAFLGTISGIGNIVGKLSFVVCKNLFSNKTTLYISCAICSFSLGLDPLFTSFTSMAVSSTLYAFALGLAYITGFALMNDVVGAEKMVDAFAWFYVVFGVSSMVASFTTGLLFDYTASYDVAFTIMGAFMFAPIISFGIEQISRKNKAA